MALHLAFVARWPLGEPRRGVVGQGLVTAISTADNQLNDFSRCSQSSMIRDQVFTHTVTRPSRISQSGALLLSCHRSVIGANRRLSGIDFTEQRDEARPPRRRMDCLTDEGGGSE